MLYIKFPGLSFIALGLFFKSKAGGFWLLLQYLTFNGVFSQDGVYKLNDLHVKSLTSVPAKIASSSGAPGQSLQPSFHGISLHCRPSKPIHSRPCCSRSVQVEMMARPAIQFIQGTDEQTIPDVRLTKSRDGTNGVAIFTFEQPSVFDSSAELGDITGFYMIDEEGVLQSVDVSAKFVNGKPARIEAKYVMRTPREWDRFMRFMERYSQANGLQFVKK